MRAARTDDLGAASDAGLDRLLTEITICRICRDAPVASAPLPQDPRPVLQAATSARILIAGQAPGKRVHASGVPYADRSGDRLREWLDISEPDFYDASRVAIVPMSFCFPGLSAAGADLPPRPECAATWHEGLFEQLTAIELVLAIGRFAQLHHFRRLGLREWLKPSLDETMRSWKQIYTARARPRVVPLPHPSWHNTRWLKSNPWFEAKLLPRLRAEVRQVLKAAPAALRRSAQG
jgi:uracil-DNA glycosylase